MFKIYNMKKIVLIFAAIVALNSCKKEDTNAEVSQDLTLANVAGSYKMTAASITTNGTSVDIFNNPNYYEACEKDDVTTFTTSGTYTIADAGTKCSPTTDDTGTYSVNTTAKTMTVDGSTMTVETFTNKKIVFSETISGVKYSYTITRQ